MSLPSISDYRSRLSSAETSIRTATTALQSASTTYERAQADDEFYGSDLKTAQAAPAVETATSDARTTAASALETARAVIRDTENPTPVLSPADEAVAASRAVIVREDCERLPLADLVSRIRQAAMSGDRIGLYLYSRFARARLTGSGTPDQPRADGEVPFRSSADDADHRNDLRMLLREIDDSLRSPDMTALHDRAVKVQSDALALDRLSRKGPTSTRQTYAFQSAGEVKW